MAQKLRRIILPHCGLVRGKAENPSFQFSDGFWIFGRAHDSPKPILFIVGDTRTLKIIRGKYNIILKTCLDVSKFWKSRDLEIVGKGGSRQILTICFIIFCKS